MFIWITTWPWMLVSWRAASRPGGDGKTVAEGTSRCSNGSTLRKERFKRKPRHKGNGMRESHQRGCAKPRSGLAPAREGAGRMACVASAALSPVSYLVLEA